MQKKLIDMVRKGVPDKEIMKELGIQTRASLRRMYYDALVEAGKIRDKLKQAETRLDSLSQEFQSLESEKRGYLQEIMRGRQLFRRGKESRSGHQGEESCHFQSQRGRGRRQSSLPVGGQLAQFRKDLIEEKQRELYDYMEQRTRYLKRIEELEVEISRYRYLVTGKKDRCLADEVIGHIKLEIHKIIRMSSEALLKEYLARGKKDDQNP